MKVVVTGSDGYIGRLVCKSIKKLDFELIEIDLKKGIDYNDVKDISGDCLIHLGAFTKVPESHYKSEEYYTNNCAKYHNFLNNNKFDRVIYASSTSVYDYNRELNPGSVYSSTKLDGEYITKRYTDNNLILRFANPVGVYPSIHMDLVGDIIHGEPSLHWKLAKWIVNKEESEIHDLKGMTRDFVPLEWISKVITKELVIYDLKGIYNIGSSINVPISQFIKHVCERYSIGYKMVPPPQGAVQGYREYISNYMWLYDYIDNFGGYIPIRDCVHAVENYVECYKEYASRT